MKKKEIIFLIIIAFIIFIPIIANEVNEYNLRKLKKDVLNLSKTLETDSEVIKEITINKKNYNIKGNGKSFLSNKGVIVVLSYKKYCVVKAPAISEVSISKSICPNYELVKGTIMKLVDSDGLVKENNNYYYKGQVDNYLKFNNELWHILSIENNKIKIIKKDPIINLKKNEALKYLNNNFYNNLDKTKIESFDYDISEVSIEKEIQKIDNKTKNLNVGMLSLDDYQKTLNKKCQIKNKVLLCRKSFITKTMWLSNYNGINSYYLYEDNNIYFDNSDDLKNVYPVLYLKESVQIKSGYGTLEEPYEID